MNLVNNIKSLILKNCFLGNRKDHYILIRGIADYKVFLWSMSFSLTEQRIENVQKIVPISWGIFIPLLFLFRTVPGEKNGNIMLLWWLLVWRSASLRIYPVKLNSYKPWKKDLKSRIKNLAISRTDQFNHQFLIQNSNFF